jgi:hypothetical protein
MKFPQWRNSVSYTTYTGVSISEFDYRELAKVGYYNIMFEIIVSLVSLVYHNNQLSPPGKCIICVKFHFVVNLGAQDTNSENF